MAIEQERLEAMPNSAIDRLDRNASEPILELLEDFEAIGTSHHVILTSRQPHFKHLQDNIRAAVVASTLNLASIDYAKRRYCNDISAPPQNDAILDAYIVAYQCSKAYVARILAKLQTDGLPEPTAGVFAASLVLERLRSSFFSAHFLYRMGHRYEGHAVSRLILEQIAWAYVAHTTDDVKKLERIQATRAIAELKRVAPEAGPLYGLLSKETHIGFGSHRSFLTIEDGQTAIWYAQPYFLQYGRVILQLADMFGVVWELTQLTYIQAPETIGKGPSGSFVITNRPFIKEMRTCLSAIEKAASKQANPSLKETRRLQRTP